MIYTLNCKQAQGDWYPERDTIAIRCFSSEYARERLKKRRIVFPVYDFLRAHGDYKGILPLTFDDVDSNDIGEEYVLFEPWHARRIKRFIEHNLGNFKDVMIHCDAGGSRSVAIAISLAKKYGWDLDPDTDISYPGGNELVYKVMRDVLGFED